MELDRNNGRGKYALVRLDKIEPGSEADALLFNLDTLGVVDWSTPGSAEEFFAIKLKDRFATYALLAYAQAAAFHDEVYAVQVAELAMRAATHRNVKTPD